MQQDTQLPSQIAEIHSNKTPKQGWGAATARKRNTNWETIPFHREWTTPRYSNHLTRYTHTCKEGKIASNSGPSIIIPSSVRMQHSLAFAFAVSILSPVTMRTKIPTFWHMSTASATSGRDGSRTTMTKDQILIKILLRYYYGGVIAPRHISWIN